MYLQFKFKHFFRMQIMEMEWYKWVETRQPQKNKKRDSAEGGREGVWGLQSNPAFEMPGRARSHP